MTRNWHLIYSEPRGKNHRLFQDDAGAISICDESGDDPNLTDDGPLIVDPDSTITVYGSRDEVVQCRVKVVATRTGEAICWVSPRVALELCKRLPKIQVRLTTQVDLLRFWLNKLAEKCDD